MTKKVLILFLFSILCASAFTQDNQFKEVIPRTPNAASLGQYGDIPVSYHTGVPDITIPIYTIEEGPLTVPISVSYHGSGIRTEDVASWVGLGFSLNAGGMVSRTIRGGRDEGGIRGHGPSGQSFSPRAGWGWYKDYGMCPEIANPYVCNPEYGYPNGAINSDGSPACHTYYFDAANGFVDSEPDLFTFNFAGNSGKFAFDENRTPYTFPWQDYYIKPINYDEANEEFFNEWLIVTPDGTKYFFGGNAATEKGYISTNGLFFIVPSSNTSTTWYLYKVESADGKHWINFSYVPENYSVTSRLSHSITLRGLGAGPAWTGDERNAPDFWMVNNIRGLRLSQITVSSGNTVVDFVPSSQPRTDLSKYLYPTQVNTEAKSLAKISISNNHGFCKDFIFDLTYFESDPNSAQNIPPHQANVDIRRLRLNTITEVSCDGLKTVPPHEFFYNPTPMARRLSLARDYWGYYNGADDNKGLIPNGIPHPYRTLPVNGGASRYVSELSMKAWSLERIKYPTGGEVLFDFEAHRYYSYFAGSEKLAGGLRINKITKKPNGGPEMVIDYDYADTRLFTPDPQDIWHFFLREPFSNPTLFAFQNMVRLEYGTIVDSSPASPVYSTQGSHIGYYFVKEKRSDGALTEYVYGGDIIIDPSFRFPTLPAQNPIGKGSLRDTKIKNSAGDIISAHYNNYSTESHAPAKAINARKVASVYNFFVPESGSGDVVNQSHGAPLDYQLWTFRHRLLGKTDILDGVTTTYAYEYDSDNKHGNPVKITKTNSEEKTIELESLYPSDPGSGAPQEMFNPLNANYKHMIGLQVESKEKVDGVYTKRNQNIFSFNALMNSIQKISSRNYPTGKTNFIEYNYTYNNANNIVNVQKLSDVASSYIWDYNESYPIAKVFNASQDQIAYTSFEADGKGNWSFTPNTSGGSSVTGARSQNLSSSIQKTELISSSKYKVSYWYKGGTATTSVTPIANSVVTYTNPGTGWTFWEGIITGVNSFSITGTGSIDELRLYPAEAQMTTYSYKPAFGITSVTDPNNLTTYYFYDSLGRLEKIKDDKGNLLKTYQYTFQGQN